MHRSRFYLAELHSINCIAYNEKLSKVALLRRRIRKHQPSQNEMHSLVEIWNMQNKAAFLEQVIFDDSDNLALLEDLVWSKSGRLFSCGLNTFLNEYDLESGRIKQSLCVNSSPAWCLTINKSDNFMAIGTEDGHICVYNIYDDSLQYDKILDRNDNRILCLEWYYPKSGGSPLLVAGSIDFIKIWNYQSGRCTDFIKVGNTGVVIWCLKVLPDFTIVSGDSSGTTSFWNGFNTTLNASFKAHKGDVLAVCANSAAGNVYSSGVDPTITEFSRMSGKSDTWIMSITKRPHTHDVRSLVCTKSNWLLSGGVDSSLVQTCLEPQKQALQLDHLPNFSRKFTAFSSDLGKYVFIQYEKYVQVWKLGSTESDLPETDAGGSNAFHVTPLKIVDNAIKLLEISSRKAILTAACNAQWLVYANYANIKVVSWKENSMEKVKVLHDPITNVSQICLTPDNRLVLSHGKTLKSFKLDTFGVVAENSVTLNSRIHQICVCDDKIVVSLADEANSVTVHSSSTLKQLASTSCPLLPSTLKVNDSNQDARRLWAAFPNALLIEYQLDSLTLLKTYPLGQFKSNENPESVSFGEYWPIKQIAFGSNLVLYSRDHNLYCLSLEKKRIVKCNKYQHIVFMENLTPQELVVVEVTPQMLLTMLPATMLTKSFGT